MLNGISMEEYESRGQFYVKKLHKEISNHPGELLGVIIGDNTQCRLPNGNYSIGTSPSHIMRNLAKGKTRIEEAIFWYPIPGSKEQ